MMMGLLIYLGKGGWGKQHHISCEDDYNKVVTNIIRLYVNNFLIMQSQVGVLGSRDVWLGCGWWVLRTQT